MEIDEKTGNPVIWKSIDGVMKLSEAIKSLTLAKGTGEIPNDALPQIDSAIKNLSIFVREEAVELKRIAKPKPAAPKTPPKKPAATDDEE